ncbi:LysR family transcriptional regulator [Allokutzneria sp. A3M-2-11 16]|uniref:LysR family transcriptional regulator n=1 Tax=Allokutzneria sp. A3M-2-11 16 TaxID=2962043 RepID=UPI0020B870B5|nr:LysR family transcriptional regulator [Allokutzneria sp. A3M-2-11 16]MCP3805195.1 LysR family transcriptional regulator [Allokutzneria sp. A3M-2-11 16]
MELRHLRYFVVVAEELNLTRAAERLCMAQPPLSVQLRKLEKELGVRLLDRSSRGVRLTDAGALLYDEARRILGSVDQASQLVRSVGTGTVGRLALGFVPSAALEVLPPILREFKASHPEITLYLNEMRPDEVLDSLHEQRIDIGLCYLSRGFTDPALRTRCVAEDPLVLAVPAAHRLAEESTVDMKELAEEQFVLPTRHRMPGLHAIITESCAANGFTPRVVQREVWLMQTIVGLVAGGIGVAVVPSSAQRLHAAEVRFLPLTGTTTPARMSAAWRPDRISPVLEAFLRLVPGGRE